jgi:hypothetical protein
MRTCGDRRYCLVEGLGALDQRPGNASPPWAPGRREEWADVERAAAHGDDIWCMAEVEIFADLTAAEMQAIAAADYGSRPPCRATTRPRPPRSSTRSTLHRGPRWRQATYPLRWGWPGRPTPTMRSAGIRTCRLHDSYAC